MIKRIHILGAAGSGTTTLGSALEKQLGFMHFDTDNYFWVPSQPPFQDIRPVSERISLLGREVEAADRWILTGSLCGWGDVFIPKFDLVVFLWIPQDIRIARLIEREKQRYGETAVEKDGWRHEATRKFIEWASRYDEGGMEIRSKAMHKAWLSKLSCPVLNLEGDLSVEERASAVCSQIEKTATEKLKAF